MVRAPHPYNQSELNWHSGILNLETLALSLKVLNFKAKYIWEQWVDSLSVMHDPHWRRNGIYDAIMISKKEIALDDFLLNGAMCFWNNSSNIFNFRLGPMTPTVLDMAALFGFTPHGKVIDVTRDYQRRLWYFVSKPIKASSK